MTHVATMSVARQLGALFEGGSTAGLSDRQLLERYLSGGREPAGEAAFAALVGRHGPMVLGVCRQLLGDAQHAEDAFQATFLVLAQKAHSIRDPDLLGNWLYGVAVRTARCARQQIARRRRREEGGAMKGPGAGTMTGAGSFASTPAEPTAPPADRPAIDREQAEAIHGEVDRLPKAFRLPVVLCYFEGLTLDEAARRLRCPAGTLRSRLARARDKLRDGLARRGIVVPAAALGAVLAPRSASASVPPLLCESTTRAAIAFAARHAATGGALSAPAAALAQEVLTTMLIHKLKLVAMTVLALAVVTTGAGYLAVAPAGAREGEPPGEPVVGEARHEPRPLAAVAGQPARMTIAGRVLDPEGRPVKGAAVDMIARLRTSRVDASEESGQCALLGQGQSDGDGRYRLEAPRIAPTRVDEFFAIAAAPGYGLGRVNLNPDAERPVADIKLLPEQPIRVRLVDLAGGPARGVEVHVLALWGRSTDEGTAIGVWLGDGPPPEGVRAWPKPVKADDQGRITLSGLGRGLSARIRVRDVPYARQDLVLESAARTMRNSIRLTPGKETTIALNPAWLIEGRVLAADTGRPIPNAIVSATPQIRDGRANGSITGRFRADDQGRFLMNLTAGGNYIVSAVPTGGEPYLIQQDELEWTKGAVKATHDIKLPRGIRIRGRVTEAGTSRPLPDASIQFIPVHGSDSVLSGSQATVAGRDDGTFQVLVPPGKGHLLIFGPTGDYVLDQIGSNTLYKGTPGGRRYRAHAIIPYEAKAGHTPRDIAASLRPGAKIRGRVEGPDGQTITAGFILTTLTIEATGPHWRGGNVVPIREGRFELHGLDPEGATRIHVLDPKHEWGATVELLGKQAGEDVTIRLQPCGRARVRFVGPDGRPVARHEPHLEFVMTPGPNYLGRDSRDRAELSADADYLANVDSEHYGGLSRTDAEGRFTIVSPIPGALYRVSDATQGIQVRKDFTVQPGETLDLGDILIEKPEGR